MGTRTRPQAHAARHTPAYEGQTVGGDIPIRRCLARARVPRASRRCPLIFIAAYGGHVECIEALMAANAHVDAPHPTGATPLQTASERGHVDAVAALLAHGADILGHDAVRQHCHRPAYVSAIPRSSQPPPHVADRRPCPLGVAISTMTSTAGDAAALGR